MFRRVFPIEMWLGYSIIVPAKYPNQTFYSHLIPFFWSVNIIIVFSLISHNVLYIKLFFASTVGLFYILITFKYEFSSNIRHFFIQICLSLLPVFTLNKGKLHHLFDSVFQNLQIKLTGTYSVNLSLL